MGLLLYDYGTDEARREQRGEERINAEKLRRPEEPDDRRDQGGIGNDQGAGRYGISIGIGRARRTRSFNENGAIGTLPT